MFFKIKNCNNVSISVQLTQYVSCVKMVDCYQVKNQHHTDLSLFDFCNWTQTSNYQLAFKLHNQYPINIDCVCAIDTFPWYLPLQSCVIADCGEHKDGDSWGIAPNDGSGDVHPDFPEDSDIDFKDVRNNQIFDLHTNTI